MTAIQHGSTPLLQTPNLKVANPPGERIHTEVIKFHHHFHAVPQVTVSLHGIDAGEEKNLRVRLEVTDVTTTQFTVKVIAWWDTIIYMAGVSWIATSSH